MQYSRLLGKTLRESPQEIKTKNHALLFKGGYIRPLGQGLFSFLPLGLRVLENLKTIIKEEMDKLGGQEVQVPVVNPSEIWKKTGRLELIGKDIIRFKDRTGRSLVLSPTHEEAMVSLSHLSLNSYRDLPVLLYQFQIKFRDEEKVRGGLIRTREFTMYDAYSFHRSACDLNNFFPRMFTAFKRIFERCGVDVFVAEAGVGYIGGEKAYEFLMEADFGDDIIVRCDNCGYQANREVAVGIKDHPLATPLPMAQVKTPDCTTIEKLSAFLDLPKSRLTKSIVYKTQNGFVMAVIRGDYEVNKEKLSRFIKTPVIRLATEEEIRANDLLPGYLSPIGMNSKMDVVLDDTVANSPNLVFGANEKGAHFLNVNFGRDFETEAIGDITLIRVEHNRCIQCGGKLREVNAVELGTAIKLGEYYSRAMELSFLDDKDRHVYPSMGTYGIGMGRLMASIVEANSDRRGIIWPSGIAPYRAFLMGIGKSLAVKQVLEAIHNEHPDQILYDDRNESPGVKFKDADLIGIPLRIVVSGRLIKEGKVEFRDMKSGKTWKVDIEKVPGELYKS